MAKSKTPKGRKKPVTSPYCKPSGSKIHQQGLFATKKILQDTEIIPYVGEKISKKEGDRRAIELAEEREGTGDASVYMFILDDDYDIDGNVPHNTARLINHSCEPNCEAQIIDDEIWIVSLSDIEKGEELTFDYGFDLEHFEDHPCRCGRPSCVGYIVAREYWPKLKKLLAAKKKKAQRSAKKASGASKKKGPGGKKKASTLQKKASKAAKQPLTVSKKNTPAKKGAGKKSTAKGAQSASSKKAGSGKKSASSKKAGSAKTSGASKKRSLASKKKTSASKKRTTASKKSPRKTQGKR